MIFESWKKCYYFFHQFSNFPYSNFLNSNLNHFIKQAFEIHLFEYAFDKIILHF